MRSIRPISGLPLAALALLVALLPVGCATGGARVVVEPPQDPSALPLDADIPLDPRVRKGMLGNGLTYVLREAPRPPSRAQLWLVVDAGSVLETESQRGLAHFVEHMAFNGTERFEKQAIVEYLESIGMRFGPDLNAYTSFDETVYMLQVPTDDEEIVQTALRILTDFAGAVTFDPEEVERERGVVIEEWRLGRGAGQRLRDRQLPILLGGSLYAERLPIGDLEVLQTVTAEELKEFYRTWYRPEHLAVVAVGDLDVDAMERRIREHFSGLEGSGPLPERPDVFPEPHAETRVSIEDDPEATSISLGLHAKRPPRPEGRLEDYRGMLAESLFHSMLNDRLEEVARRPDAPIVFAGVSSSRFVRHVSLSSLGAQVPEGRVEEGLEAAAAELERVQRHGFRESELDRAKRNLLRTYEQAAKEVDNENSRAIAAEFVRHVLTAEPVPGIEVERALVDRFLPGIGVEEIDAIADAWMEDRDRVLLVSAPSAAESPLPGAETLLAAVERVDAAALEPWEDATPDAPLVAEEPEPGRIVGERDIDALGITEWTLSNGLTVLLKPTDFREDQVLLSGWSPGGMSLVSTVDLPSAMLAAGIADESGLGPYDRLELQKFLAGTQASVGLRLGQLEESVGGGASAEDLGLLFRLLWLRFQEPRFDAEAWERLRSRLDTMIAHREKDPGQVFGEKLGKVLTQDSPRRPDFDREFLASVDLDTAEAIYRDRFSDASDFTFAVVGSFDPEDLRPLVETWLASLPAGDRAETWADEGIDRPEGQVRFEVEKGLEPKARVQLILHGDASWSREEQHRLGSLSDAMESELRQLLREELGGTYGVSVGASLSARPEERFSVSISFGCDPERVDELITRLDEELERFRSEGFEAATVENVREAQRRARETALEENGAWLGWIRSTWSLGLEPETILQFDELLADVTAETLRETARRYLDDTHRVLGILRPETVSSPPASSDDEATTSASES